MNGVSLEIPPGCIFGLVGENGAGKSTFVKCITGIYKADAGSVSLGGNVSMIPQEFNLAQDLSVCENIFLGREPVKGCLIDRKKMAEESSALLETLSASEISPYAGVADLNVAEKQMVEIAKALSEKTPIESAWINEDQTFIKEYTALPDFVKSSAIYYAQNTNGLVPITCCFGNIPQCCQTRYTFANCCRGARVGASNFALDRPVSASFLHTPNYHNIVEIGF